MRHNQKLLKLMYSKPGSNIYLFWINILFYALLSCRCIRKLEILSKITNPTLVFLH